MDHRISKPGVILSIIGAILAFISFVYLNEAFQGPSLLRAVKKATGNEPYQVAARFKDTEILPPRQPVTIRGIIVGKTTQITFNKEGATGTVNFTVKDEYAPIYRDAKVLIGERSVLGDPYINLDPGHAAAGELPAGSELKGTPSVDFDEAFDFLDAKGRRHVNSIIDETADGVRTPGNGERLNATLGQLARTVGELRTLTGELRGQESNLTALIGDGATVLHALGTREAALRDISRSGRLVLDGLASNTESLNRGLAQVPALLTSARTVLIESRPLLRELRPLIVKVRRAAPSLRPILSDLPKVSGDALDTVTDLSSVPTFREVLKIFKTLRPLIPDLEAATRNTTALMRYSAPRAKGIAAFFSNLVGAFSHGDSTGKWVRFYIGLEPGETADSPTPATCTPEDDVSPNAGVCHNAYPKPNDALDNEPYVPGSYPRLRPYTPPPAKK